MRILSEIGRIFYGMVIAGMGCQAIYYHDFPYMLLPPHPWIAGHVMITYIFGALFILAGACIVFKIKIEIIPLLLGTLLLLIVCSYHIPYEFMTDSNYMRIGEWENAEKDLALSGGAFVIAGCFSEENENLVTRFLRKLIPLGTILFALMMAIFGTYHFLFTKEASTLVPWWLPDHMFWTYLGGVALIGSGVAIALKIKRGLISALLGTMIFIWFIILHIPRVMVAPSADVEDEVTSAFLALAYSGTAFVIAGATKNRKLKPAAFLLAPGQQDIAREI